MTTGKSGADLRMTLGVLAVCVSNAFALPSHAQVPTNIVTDGTLGTTSTAAGVTPRGGTAYEINGGTVWGSNQFHSFDRFSVGTVDAAMFNGPAGIQNIVSRVTGMLSGPAPSQIDGYLSSLISGANMFLMNPAGIIFGPNAQLNVSGAFHATTADYIKLGNDGIFYADPAQTSVLTVSAPSAFGFLSANPKPIEVQTGSFGDVFCGDVFCGVPVNSLLSVPEGQTLSLIGGSEAGSAVPGVSIGALDGSSPGYLLAPGGRINLVSVASPGLAAFDAIQGFRLDGTNVNGDRFTQLGGINIGPGSIVDGKDIFIRGGKLMIQDGIVMPGAFANEMSFTLDPATGEPLRSLPDGGGVNINVTGDVTITGSPFTFEPLTFKPPGIHVYSGDPLFISPAAKLPDVTIDAGSVSITGFATIEALRNAPGETGKVVIKAADKVSVGSGGSIALINRYAGDGPSLEITAKQVDISGDGSPGAFGVEGLFVQGLTFGLYPIVYTDAEFITANSGAISITATDSLKVSGLGQITTDSLSFGKAGDISINAGNVLVAGTGDPQSALIGSQSNFAGDSGNITIDATGSIAVQNGGRITTATFGSGNAGNITLKAAGPITLSGQDARIVGATFQPPDSQLNSTFLNIYGGQTIFDADFTVIDFIPFDFNYFRNLTGNANASLMQVLAYMQSTPIGLTYTNIDPPAVPVVLVPILDLKTTPGNAGMVSFATPQLTLNPGTRIETSTGWEGNAGSVVATVGNVSLLDGGAIRSRSGVEFLDGTTGIGPGNAGSIEITASGTITVSGAGSAISTSTFGDGQGGNVTLIAGDQVSVQSGGRIVGESGGILGGAVAVGIGSGGGVSISAGNAINVSGPGSTVSTTTFGDGAGGSVTLTGSQVNVLNGGRVASESGGMLGGMLAVGAGDAGTVTINATGANTLTISGAGSIVSTSTLGDGDGGDVILTSSGDVKILDGGSITADSLGGAGLTGTIEITAGNSIIMDNGTISTRAVTSDGGNIKLTAPYIVQLTGSKITTSVESGVGGGGNINIDPQFVILNNSTIIANAYGGPGGNITIVADNFLQSITSLIEASSALSTPGTIQIVSPDNNVENSIAQLASAFLDASSQLRGLCSARRTGAPSSFAVAGRGGVPVDAGGYLPSFGSDVATGLAGARGPVRADAGPALPSYALTLAMADYGDCSR